MFGFRGIIGEYKGSHLWRNIKRTLLKLSTPKAFFFVVKEKYVVSCFKVNVFLFWLTTSLDDSRFVRSRCERIPYMVLKGKLDVQKQWTRSERKLNSFQLLLSFCKLWLCIGQIEASTCPPGQPPGHLTFLKVVVQIPPYPDQNVVQIPHTRVHSGDQMAPPRGHFTGTKMTEGRRKRLQLSNKIFINITKTEQHC